MINYIFLKKNFFLIVLFFLCICILCYTSYKFIKTDFKNIYYIYILFITLLLSISLIIINKFFKKFINVILIIIYSVLFSLYAFEYYLFNNLSSLKLKNHIPLNILAQNSGLNWDNRSNFEFYLNLKEEINYFFPNYYPYQLLSKGINEGFNINGEKILPLGSISNSKTFLGNELGFYPVVKNDKYGFINNNNNDYEKKVDFVLIGDSYIEGCCTNNEDSITGIFKKNGYRTLSFGKSGAGPLTEFAIIREYLNNNDIKYSNLIWFFYENDFENLDLELNSKILLNYLKDDNFNQNLINKQKLLDKILIDYINKEISKKKLNNDTLTSKNIIEFKYEKFDLFNFIKLINIRSIFYLMPKNNNENIFRDILDKSKKIVEKNDADMYFVYIPSVRTFSHSQRYQFKKNVEKIVEDLDIKMIDLTKSISDLDNPLSVWPFECCGHFNEKGYKVVTSFIIDHLEIK